MGAVVTKNVPPGATFVGNPARPLGELARAPTPNGARGKSK
jgi:acetyltransferase-like isoleucine patch superfamily enzyme